MHKHSLANRQLIERGYRPLLLVLLIISLALALACNRAPENTTASNDPDQLLRQMSDKLGQAKKLNFKVDRKLEAALVEGSSVPENAQLEISVSRPGKFLAKSDTKDTVRTVFFDGQNLSIYDQTMNLYATVAVPGTIDEVVAKIDEKYGFTPPLAEFILSDSYKALGPQLKNKTYKGKETVAGVECYHVSFSGDAADSELWIGTADSLPYKLMATFKDREGSPKLQADFSGWNLKATLEDQAFTFTAPKDAEKVDMITEAQMKETAEKEIAAQQKSAPKTRTSANATKE